MVYFDQISIEAYLERHGFGVVARSSTGSSTGSSKTGPDEGTRAGIPKSPKRSSEALNDTDENGPSSTSDHS